jgi:hypothetical protein
MRMTRALHGLLGVVAVTVPAARADTDGARIYVYAQRLTEARSWLAISVGQTRVAQITRGTFFAVDVPPGQHSVSLENGVPAILRASPGGECYVRLDWSLHINRRPVPALSVVPHEQARREIRFLTYIEGRRIVSPAVLRADPRTTEDARLKRRGEPDKQTKASCFVGAHAASQTTPRFRSSSTIWP